MNAAATFDQTTLVPISLCFLNLLRGRERERVDALPLVHARGYNLAKSEPASGNPNQRK
jgi:hypothetical protein